MTPPLREDREITRVACGAEIPDAQALYTPIAELALHSSRAEAPVNGDAAVLVADEEGRPMVALFDPGPWRVDGREGAPLGLGASKLAADCLVAHLREAGPSRSAAELALEVQRAGESAHRMLLGRGREEATSLIAATVSLGCAIVAASGIYLALQIREGALLTEMSGARREHALGRGGVVETAFWTLDRGDTVVLGSGALLDMPRSEIIARATRQHDAVDAAIDLSDEVFARMREGRVRATDLSLVVIRSL